MSSYLLHLTPLPLLILHPQLGKLPHLHPLRPDKDPPVPPALEIPLPRRGHGAVVLPHGLVQGDADPGPAGGSGQRGDRADVRDCAPLCGGGRQAAAGGGVEVCGGGGGGVRMGFDGMG